MPLTSIPSSKSLSTTPAPRPIESISTSDTSNPDCSTFFISSLIHPTTCIKSNPFFVIIPPASIWLFWRTQIALLSDPLRAMSTPITTGPSTTFTSLPIASSTKSRGTIVSSSSNGNSPSTRILQGLVSSP